MKPIIILYTLIFITIAHGYGQTFNSDPNKVEFITADISRFWSAFDSCQIYPKRSIEIYNRIYFGKGTAGLQTFKAVSIKSTKNLVDATEKYKLFYKSIRQNTFEIEKLKPTLRKSLTKFNLLYPSAKFPNVYFLIGDLNSGGKSEKEGLLIGCEVNCADSNSNFTNIYPPFIKVLKSLTPKNIPLIVIHELVHYQQSYIDSNTNLLGYVIKEGSADFICNLIMGKTINDVIYTYGKKHDRELWDEFKNDFAGYDISKWLYNKATDERPKDLGYYMGYKITESYYLNSKDKRSAIKDILNIKDFNLFLKQSRYEEKFN